MGQDVDPSGYQLIGAAKLGDIRAASRLLKAGANVNMQDRHGRTALLIAIEKSNSKLASLLLENDADPSLCDNRGNSPLMRCTNDRIFEMLLDKKPDLNAQDEGGRTALCRKAESGDYISQVRQLIDAGADVNLESFHGWSALRTARQNKQAEIARMLIEAGADVYAPEAAEAMSLYKDGDLDFETQRYGNILPLVARLKSKKDVNGIIEVLVADNAWSSNGSYARRLWLTRVVRYLVMRFEQDGDTWGDVLSTVLSRLIAAHPNESKQILDFNSEGRRGVGLVHELPVEILSILSESPDAELRRIVLRASVRQSSSTIGEFESTGFEPPWGKSGKVLSKYLPRLIASTPEILEEYFNEDTKLATLIYYATKRDFPSLVEIVLPALPKCPIACRAIEAKLRELDTKQVLDIAQRREADTSLHAIILALLSTRKESEAKTYVAKFREAKPKFKRSKTNEPLSTEFMEVYPPSNSDYPEPPIRWIGIGRVSGKEAVQYAITVFSELGFVNQAPKIAQGSPAAYLSWDELPSKPKLRAWIAKFTPHHRFSMSADLELSVAIISSESPMPVAISDFEFDEEGALIDHLTNIQEAQCAFALYIDQQRREEVPEDSSLRKNIARIITQLEKNLEIELVEAVPPEYLYVG